MTDEVKTHAVSAETLGWKRRVDIDVRAWERSDGTLYMHHDMNVPVLNFHLSAERLAEIVEEELAKADAAEAAARAERLTGARCMCCGDEMPADRVGQDECASCADNPL